MPARALHHLSLHAPDFVPYSSPSDSLCSIPIDHLALFRTHLASFCLRAWCLLFLKTSLDSCLIRFCTFFRSLSQRYPLNESSMTTNKLESKTPTFTSRIPIRFSCFLFYITFLHIIHKPIVHIFYLFMCSLYFSLHWNVRPIKAWGFCFVLFLCYLLLILQYLECCLAHSWCWISIYWINWMKMILGLKRGTKLLLLILSWCHKDIYSQRNTGISVLKTTYASLHKSTNQEFHSLGWFTSTHNSSFSNSRSLSSSSLFLKNLASVQCVSICDYEICIGTLRDISPISLIWSCQIGTHLTWPVLSFHILNWSALDPQL